MNHDPLRDTDGSVSDSDFNSYGVKKIAAVLTTATDQSVPPL